MFQVSAMCRTQEIIIQRHQENNHEPKPQDATSKNNKRHSNNKPRQLNFKVINIQHTLEQTKKNLRICRTSSRHRRSSLWVRGSKLTKITQKRIRAKTKGSASKGNAVFAQADIDALSVNPCKRWQDLLCVKVSCK